MDTIAVVGGGLVGSSAAYRLACHGARVTLVDRADEGQATAAGAGILAPGSRFVGADALLPLLKHAHAYFPDLLARLADDGEHDTGYEVVGALHVATTEQQASHLPELLHQAQQRQAAGFHHVGAARLVDGDAARRLFPALGGAVLAAVHLDSAARVDGRALCEALRRAARRRGATLLHGDAELLLDGDRAAGVRVDGRIVAADAVIIAAGAWSARSVSHLAVRLPVGPQRGQLAHLRLPGVDSGRWPSVLGFHPHYLVTFPADRVVIGATRENQAGWDHRVTAAGLHEVLDQALRLAPGLAGATVEEVRVGFRPASPDHNPVLGQVPGVPNAYLATGHGGYGLQVGPWSGAVVADLVLGRPVGLDLSPFAVGRFDHAVQPTDSTAQAP